MRFTAENKILLADIDVNTGPVNSVTLWNSGTSYAVGATCYEGNFVYEAATANENKQPSTNAGGAVINRDWLAAGYTAVAVPDWYIVGMINPLKVIDSYVSTKTVTTGTGAITHTFEYQKSGCNALYFLNAEKIQTIDITVTDTDDVVLVDKTIDLSQDFIMDEADYYWKPVQAPRTEQYVDLGVITFATDTISIVMHGVDSMGIGKIVTGYSQEIGDTQWNVECQILDFNELITDRWGERYRDTQGPYSRTITATIDIPIVQFDNIFSLFASQRATDGVYDFTNDIAKGTVYDISSAIVYGIPRDTKHSIPTKGVTTLSTQIEGSK